MPGLLGTGDWIPATLRSVFWGGVRLCARNQCQTSDVWRQTRRDWKELPVRGGSSHKRWVWCPTSEIRSPISSGEPYSTRQSNPEWPAFTAHDLPVGAGVLTLSCLTAILRLDPYP